jgi:ribonuclease HI
MSRRGMAKTSFCQICGQEEEDTFHIFVRCPHARALWMAMKEEWTLPDDDLIKPTGKEWLLQLLNGIPSTMQARTMLIFWRIWHNHNEMTHDKPCPSLEGSQRFLVSYLNSLLLIKQHPGADMEKRKMVITHEAGFRKEDRRSDGSRKVKKTWTPPGVGRLKLNVDGAFSSSGGAGAGMMLRDHQGSVVAAACRALVQCRDATEAELLAIEEGLRLALLWSPLPFTVETDSSEAAELIKETTPNISIYAFTISAIREMLQERDISVIKISRDANRASHELAKIGRVDQRNAIWFVDLPLVVSQAIEFDCNPVAI